MIAGICNGLMVNIAMKVAPTLIGVLPLLGVAICAPAAFAQTNPVKVADVTLAYGAQAWP